MKNLRGSVEIEIPLEANVAADFFAGEAMADGYREIISSGFEGSDGFW